MQTKISEVSPVERELEIEADAEEMEPRLNKALRTYRSRVDLKGFRKGKVPLSIVKKMYGQAVGLQVAEEFVQEAFEETTADKDDLDVLGQPEMTDLDYEVDGDLRAVIRFAVRPEIELKDISDEEIPKLVHEITDEEVEEEIEKLRRHEADLIPKEEEGAEEEDFVLFDLQELDAESDQPIIGNKDEDQSLFLDSPQVENNPMLQELRDAVLGAKPGDTVRFTFEHDQAHGEHDEAHAHRFEVQVKEVKRRELPPLDDAFVAEVTEDEFIDLESFRAAIRERLEEAWQERSRELLQGRIVERMLELHPVPVPDQLIETYLDSFMEDVKQRNDGELPENFDETHFRNQNRDEARQQAHWMLLRDKIIEENDLEVTDEDVDAFFEEQAEGEDVTAEQIRRFYQNMPDLMNRIRQQLLSRKVFEVLEERFNVVEKDREAFERSFEEERQAAVVGGEEEEGAPDESSPLVEPGA